MDENLIFKDDNLPEEELNDIDPTLEHICPQKEKIEESITELDNENEVEEYGISEDVEKENVNEEVSNKDLDIEAKEKLISDDKSSEEEFNEMSKKFDEMHQLIVSLGESTEKTLSEIKEVHKLYHNEYAGRLAKMQKELDLYHEIETKNIFNEIFMDIARIYIDNEPILLGIENEKNRKQVGFLFDDIEQLLDSYDVQIHRSNVGDKRNVRLCKIQKTIETDNPDLNDTVAKSIKPGFFKDNYVLIKEIVEVFVYRTPEI